MTAASSLIARSIAFARQQTANFKLMLVRRTVHAVGTGLSIQYNSIFATLLGADAVQLGSLQSAGNAIGALAALPAGWLIDSASLKKVFIVGTIMLGASAGLYMIAPHWTYLYAAIILYYMGSRVVCTSCSVTCATELANENRATGRGICRTLSSVASLATPIFAAWVVSLSGGINIVGLRRLYGVQVAVFVVILALLAIWLREPARVRAGQDLRSIVAGFTSIVRGRPHVVRTMLLLALMELPWSMAQPFMPLYAHEAKGADEFVLGGLALALSLAPLLLSIPLGRLADRFGRKALLFAIAPLSGLGNLLLILAAGKPVLMAAGFFFGFNSIAMAIAAAMAAEIVPREQMGRWIGMVSLIRGLVSVPAPMVGGFIWDAIGPQYVFIAAVALDLGLRLPLLASLRETLHMGKPA